MKKRLLYLFSLMVVINGMVILLCHVPKSNRELHILFKCSWREGSLTSQPQNLSPAAQPLLSVQTTLIRKHLPP